MARQLASAWVGITPTGFADFGRKARDGIKQALKGASATVPVDADTKPATLSLDALKGKLEDLASRVAQARVGLDDKEADAALAAIAVKLDRLDGRAASPRITLEGAAAVEAQLLALDVSFDKVQGKLSETGVAAAEAGSGFTGLAGGGMAALIAGGVALSPILATLAVGTAGLGAAAAKIVSPILAAGTATKAQQQALASLDPAQRAAYDSLGALKDQFGGFAQALEPTALDLFNKGLRLANSLMSDVEPVAKATGDALGGLLGAIDTEFRSGTWQDFFGFMAAQAGPDVQLVTNALIPLLDTLPRLLTTLQPIAVQFLQTAAGVLQLADAAVQLNQKIDQLGSHASSSSGLVGKLADAAKRAVGQILPGVPAAQQLVKWLGKLGDSSGSAAKNTADLGANTSTLAGNVKIALPPTQQVADNLALEAFSAGLASSAVTTLNNAWTTFLGLSTGLEGAQLAVEGGLTALHNAAKTTGATFTGTDTASQNLQSAFESGLLPSVQQVIGGMRQAHSSSKDLAKVVATDLKPAVDAGALSNTAFKTQLYDLAVQAGYTGPNKLGPLKTWFDKNATSTDAAKRKVDEYAASLGKVPTHVLTTIEAIAQGKGGVTVTASQQGIAAKTIALTSQHLAAGGLIMMGSGPTADDVPAMLSRGELVVPAGMVAAGAVDHLRGMLPGFASGGLAGAVSAWPGSVSSAYNSDVSQALGSDTSATIAAIAAAIRKAQQFAGIGNYKPGAGVQQWRGVVQQALGLAGANVAQLTDAVLYQMQTESGGNPTIVNTTDINWIEGHPSVGLMQVIRGTFQAYAGQFRNTGPFEYGVSVNPLANVFSAIRYAQANYGPGLRNAYGGIGSGHGYALGGLVGMAAGGKAKAKPPVKLQFTQWMNQLKSYQAHEAADYRGLESAFAHGPAKYRSHAALALLALAKRQANEAKQYQNIARDTSSVTPNQLGALANATWAELTASNLGALAAGPGGHPGWVGGLKKWLTAINKMSQPGREPYNLPWAPRLGASHSVLGGVLTFDQGGLLPPGLSLAYNGLGRSEVVSPGGAQRVEVVLSVDPGMSSGLGAELLRAIRYQVRTIGGGDVARTYGRGT